MGQAILIEGTIYARQFCVFTSLVQAGDSSAG